MDEVKVNNYSWSGHTKGTGLASMTSVTHSMRHMFPNEFPVWPFQLLNNYRSPATILLQLIFSFSQMVDDAKLPSLVESIWMRWYLLLLGRFISVWQKLFVAQGYTATSFIYPNHLTSMEAEKSKWQDSRIKWTKNDEE